VSAGETVSTGTSIDGVEGRESVKGSSIFTGLTTGLIVQTTRDSNMKRRRCDESGIVDGVERGCLADVIKTKDTVS
jgi:hypothetical protein